MTDEAMSPLRRRMIEDMTIRKFAPKTQHATCRGSRILLRSLAARRILRALMTCRAAGRADQFFTYFLMSIWSSEAE